MSNTIPILTFHAIDNRKSVISISPTIFRFGIDLVHSTGYQVLNSITTLQSLNNRNLHTNPAIAITFDDGYESVYTQAFPMIQRLGMKATVFLTVGSSTSKNSDLRLKPQNNRRMLSWREIREMHSYGIEFGAHTLTHPDLTRISIARATTEIIDSKQRIEDALSTEVSCFAYPFGSYNQNILEIVKSNFLCAYTTKLGLASSTNDVFTLKRVDMYYLRTKPLFRILPTKWFPWFLRAINIPRSIRQNIRSRF